MKRATGIALAALLAGLALTTPAGAASAPYEKHTVIVKYAKRASASQRSLAARLAGIVERVGRVKRVGAQIVRVSGDPAAAAERLRRSGAVRYAEPNYIVRATAVPNDPRFGAQYGLHNTGQTGGTPDADIDAPEGWDAAGLGAFGAAPAGAKIGIVDSGVQAGHEELAGQVVDCAGVRSFGVDVLGLVTLPLFADPTVVAGRCADDNGHGTHVAGIAAARANNARGIAGVAFNSPLAICKGVDASGAGGVAGIANCIAYLVSSGAQVISMSLGTTAKSATLRTAVAAASDRALIVAASGNSGGSTVEYPAGYASVVSVGATDSRDGWAPFSTANRDVEVAAPGVEILSSWNNGGYRSISGTSMATPHVAGVAAIIAGRYPASAPSLWRDKLDAAVDDVLTRGRDRQTGFGRVSLAKAATG